MIGCLMHAWCRASALMKVAKGLIWQSPWKLSGRLPRLYLGVTHVQQVTLSPHWSIPTAQAYPLMRHLQIVLVRISAVLLTPIERLYREICTSGA